MICLSTFAVYLLVAITIGDCAQVELASHASNDKLANFEWKAFSTYNNKKANLEGAVVGGQGKKGKTIYVCRTRYHSLTKTEKLPGTYESYTSNPGDGYCSYTQAGLTRYSYEFELLTTSDPNAVTWEKVSSGKVCSGALVGGFANDKTDFLIARAVNKGNYQQVGKYIAKDTVAYVPGTYENFQYGTVYPNEYATSDFEILCLN